jgi:threonine dehydrogenase-like Zn-dependent dehydrogenase
LARLSGFSPIIATASEKHTDFLKSLGTTHVLSRSLSAEAIIAEVKKITAEPVKVVYDAVSLPDTQKTAWSVLAPGGQLIIVLFATEGIASGQDGKTITHPFGNVNYPGQEVGRELYARLTELLKDGSIKVSAAPTIGVRRSSIDIFLSRTAWRLFREDSMAFPTGWSSCTRTKSVARSSSRIPRRLHRFLNRVWSCACLSQALTCQFM